ncbi:MAG TPA: hypothetical protein VGF87_08305 [Acidimicrobiales bacterium]|jgi:hypothetical protein
MAEPTNGLAEQIPLRRRGLALVPAAPVELQAGEIVPAVLIVEHNDFNISVPVGAYVLRDGKPCFVPTVDFDGIVAIMMGIGVGGLAVWKIAPVFRAIASRIDRR